MNCHYQLANETHLGILIDLMRDFYSYEQMPFETLQMTTALRQLLKHPEYGRLWVIYRDSLPIGYTSLTFCYSLEHGGLIAWVDELFVRSDARGQGVGSQTLKFLYKTVQEITIHNLKVQSLQLEVRSDNVQAQTCYQKFGFVPEDRLIMTRWLVPTPATKDAIGEASMREMITLPLAS
jgi:RimJ/RimL family protein N-acetyltransferase